MTEILRGSEYALTIFTPQEVAALEIYDKAGRPYLRCQATGKEHLAKPEEIVRQLCLRRLIHSYGYPRERIVLEEPVYFGSTIHEKVGDTVVYEESAPTEPYIIVETERLKRRDGIEQLKSYCNVEGSPIGVWVNGSGTVALYRQPPNNFRNLADIPKATQTLADVLGERWAIADLEAKNKFVHERTTFKGVILDMENLVLASAGVDAFEEVFKLIFAKLFDEWKAEAGGRAKRYLGGFQARIEHLYPPAEEQPRERGDGLAVPGLRERGVRRERLQARPAALLVQGPRARAHRPRGPRPTAGRSGVGGMPLQLTVLAVLLDVSGLSMNRPAPGSPASRLAGVGPSSWACRRPR